VTETAADLTDKVALVTGAARRIGAVIARILHAQGMRIAVHYRHSADSARELKAALNTKRSNSVELYPADLRQPAETARMVGDVVATWGRLDVLINNASTFYPTPFGTITENAWEDLIGTNLKAPLFLSQAAAPHLAKHAGCIVNLTDIYGQRPLREHPVYCTAKAGLIMLTRALARDLGPAVRVNAVAPGAILWPEEAPDDDFRARIVARAPLKRQGTPEELARAVLFFVRDATFSTGEMVAVDGGRLLSA
jgi:pteridine reductase